MNRVERKNLQNIFGSAFGEKLVLVVYGWGRLQLQLAGLLKEHWNILQITWTPEVADASPVLEEQISETKCGVQHIYKLLSNERKVC